MDTLGGNFAGRNGAEEAEGLEPEEETSGRDTPPPEIGQDERRMQVRAYNFWASLLEDRNFPSIDDLETDNLPDFGPYSVLLDFTSGIEDPGIAFLGDKIAEECEAGEEISRLSDVPSRSLLSRITDHYMQILANQAPIGFEAEFINQRGSTILYRGILLPFSSDDDTIDFIYGVINWKELADQKTTDELMLEVDQALEELPAVAAEEEVTSLSDWANSSDSLDLPVTSQDPAIAGFDSDGDDWDADETALPAPTFGSFEAEDSPHSEIELEDTFENGSEEFELGAELELGEAMELASEEPASEPASPQIPQACEPEAFAPEPIVPEAYEGETSDAEQFVPDYGEPEAVEPEAPEPAAYTPEVPEPDAYQPTEIEMPELDESDMALGDWLASARELALAARSSEDRTRHALYDAISRAYDFSIAASEAPEEFDELVADSGLTMQDRAPMTPIVKLVFGADYDKTRLTEYAAALTHAHRLELERGSLGDFLRKAEGGLKGVVKAERRLRREESGQAVEAPGDPRERIAKKLRKLEGMEFGAIPSEGKEFGLVMIRRLATGEVVVLGEIPDDVALVERAARKLLG
ncbi:MAG TPA: hypothetical protein VLA37_13615 [Sphingomonadaceae bacterium]|nr:hypothetical protein [Sphingomonadaceae bacterium]